MNDPSFHADSFAENPEPRLPCVLILDVSRSMAGEKISQLNEAIAVYKQELSKDSLASKRVEVAVITFSTEVAIVRDFSLASDFAPPPLKAGGWTFMGRAVTRAIELLERRKQVYKSNGVSYYRPWLLLISDGSPNDPDWQEAAKRAVAAERAKAFKMFCIGVANANLEKLGQFCAGEPVKLKGLRFRDMFLWLSSSQQSVSRSSPGDEVPLENPTTPEGWASIA